MNEPATVRWSDVDAAYVLDIVLVDPCGRPMLSEDDLWLRVGAQCLELSAVRLSARPDIVDRHPWVSLWCGQSGLFAAPRPTFPCTVDIMRNGECVSTVLLAGPADAVSSPSDPAPAHTAPRRRRWRLGR